MGLGQGEASGIRHVCVYGTVSLRFTWRGSDAILDVGSSFITAGPASESCVHRMSLDQCPDKAPETFPCSRWRLMGQHPKQRMVYSMSGFLGFLRKKFWLKSLFPLFHCSRCTRTIQKAPLLSASVCFSPESKSRDSKGSSTKLSEVSHGSWDAVLPYGCISVRSVSGKPVSVKPHEPEPPSGSVKHTHIRTLALCEALLTCPGHEHGAWWS